MSDTAHSHYGMSSISRWTSCLASPRLCADAPPGFDEAWTVEGKVAHALLQKLLDAREDQAGHHIGTTIAYDVLDGEIQMGVVKPETARAVQIALDQVYEILEMDPAATLWVEKKVEIPSTSIPGRLWGTADVVIYLPKWRRLYAIDYKHGAGIFVDVQDNMQVKGYALAALLTLIDGPVDEIHIGIVQPRAFSDEGSIRWDVMDALKLLDYYAWLDERAALTLDPDAPFKPDTKICRWCPAAILCPAQEQAALDGTGAKSIVEFLARPPLDPTKLPLIQVSAVLKAYGFFNALYKAARAVAMGAAYRGFDVPDFKLVNGKAQRAWYGEPAEIADALALVTGQPIERFYPATLITITEAEQVVVDHFRSMVVRENGETKKAANYRANKAAEMAHEFMAQLTLKEPGASVTLASVTDPRPRVDAAASNFAGLIHVDPQTKE